jgi:hypothetical protein
VLGGVTASGLSRTLDYIYTSRQASNPSLVPYLTRLVINAMLSLCTLYI